MLKLGIIGCGRIVEYAHAEALKRLSEEVAVVALSDPSQERLEAVGRLLDIETTHRYTDYQEMLNREELDFADIAVPPFLHEKTLLACAEAKVHVILEKPIASTLEEVDRMLEAVAANGITLSVLHNYRYSPGAAKALELVSEGRIGAPFLFRSEVLSDGYWPGAAGYDPAWRTKSKQAGGGCLIDNGYHNIYLAREIMQSPVVSVYARIGTFGSEMDVDDTAVLMLTHASGGITSIQVSWAVKAGVAGIHEVFGNKGAISFTPGIYTGKPVDPVGKDNNSVAVFDHATAAWEYPELDYGYGISFAGLMHDCFQQHKQGKTIFPDGQEARKNLAVISAAYESARTGKVVEIS
ncbi:MAG: Gfo/Idh/MocA family oxidoreductase [Candidatus Latescibacterota bacterium]